MSVCGVSAAIATELPEAARGSGHYRVRASAEVHTTSSPSMDISKASNFERYVHDGHPTDAERADITARIGATRRAVFGT